jgi:class 3 adenylate cyclase/tetratricopeptide (TPR) repeat protein
MESRGAADGERKTITALFADLKGSTALIEGLDPEEARSVIDPALQLMMDAVHQYDGYVAQALGDGIFALFGAPIAHEDHPQRAVYAALRMQDAMRRYADTLRAKGYPPLLMRVGLNTGEVVLRSIRKDDLHADYVPVGHSTNLAARMEQLATPGSIVVSAYTHRLTDGYFAFKDLGPTQIKGVEDALNIYEVLGMGQFRTRLQVSASRYGLTRFVGRQSELEQLKRALEQAKVGRGQIVGTMGEPGLGKSRLFHEFKLLSLSGCLVLEAYSVSHGKATAYLPVIELLKSYFDIQTADDERKRREKVAGKVVILDRTLEEILPYLYALLGIEEQPSPLQQMDAQIRRRRTFEALKKLFLRESLNQPLILIFEDLHWIDGETQGFLDVLSESVASAKLLLLTNYRPEYRHEWGQKTYYTQLRLAPLGREEAEEFLDELLGEQRSPRPVGERDRERVTDPSLHALKQLILDKTQGTPFFMEEIVQELIEQGVLVRAAVGAHSCAPLPTELHIPPTVQGVLAARIDRLAPEEKALLQQLSVIGRQFPMSLVRQVITQPEADLYRLLASLQHKEFLYEQPAFPESEYLFKHALTQEVAYGTVLQEQRKVLHERTGQAIESLYSAKLEDHYSELAHHYRRSGNTAKAIEYLYKAGQQVVKRSANTEAIALFTTALELLKALPETLTRHRQELTLQLALGPALNATKGFNAPEVGITYTRAQELCRQVNEPSLLFDVLMGLRVFHTVRGQYQKALSFGQQLVQLADTDHDPAVRTAAHYAITPPLFFLGRLASAREHCTKSLHHYDRRQHESQVLSYGQSHGVQVLGYYAFALYFLGYPDQALEQVRAGVRLAHELAHPFSLTQALYAKATIRLSRSEPQEARVVSKTLSAIAAEHGMLMISLVSEALVACAACTQGGGQEELERLRHALDRLQQHGIYIWMPTYVAQLAEAYGRLGRVEEGLQVLGEALTDIRKEGGSFYEAELHRLKGELTLQQHREQATGNGQQGIGTDPRSLLPDPQGEAEECFLRAIEIAQKQQAKSLELRAVMSLARLWQQQALEQSAKSKAARAGNTEHASRNTHHATRITQHGTRTRLDEARDMLSEVYNWFTEGFDTKDLQEAKGLIEELSH